MDGALIWDVSDYPIANGSHIQEVGFYGEVQDWYGSFIYDYYGNISGGSVTSTTSYLNGVQQYTVTGLNHNVVTIFGYVNSSNESGLLNYLFNGNDVFNGSSGADVINAYAGNDSVLGNGGNDVLRGGSGNDSLNGGAGNDILAGGAGNDTYTVTTGDTLVEGASAGIDTVRSSVTTTLGANLEKLILTGTTAINGTGNTLNNALTGNSGNNFLNGGTGNDTLNGGAGNDTLVGGPGLDSLNGSTGRDIFLFKSPLGASSVDTISGFSHADDTIRLDDDIFTAIGLAPNTVLTAAKYKENATGVATDSSDRIIYNTTNGNLFYDPDGNGPTAAVKFAVISGGPDEIDQTDFFVVG
ncbi:MAG: hypothetical protein HYY48_04855 [Gammaproteobacteria bacterium]|nr:hypothetical protein [Gammaproteobacteria bacterium]